MDRRITEQAGLILACAMVGVLLGRGWPAFIGQPRSLRVALVGATTAGAVIAGAAALLLIDDWLLRQAVLLLGLVTAGSAATSFIQCLLAAAVQQQVPDAIRGRLSGSLWAARLVLVAVSIAGSSYLVERFDSTLYLALLAAAFTILLVTSRGLRSLRQ